MRLSTKIAYNTIIQVASKIVSTILGLAAIAVITRYLGRDGFGQYTTIITYLSFFGVIIDLGLTLITVQMISRPGADEQKIIGNLFAFRLFSSVALLALAPLLILLFPYGQEVKSGVAIAVFSFLFVALNQILVGIFQKNLRMDKVSIAEIAGRVLLVAGAAVTVRLDAGLTGIMAATVVSSFLNFFLLHVFSRPFVRIKLQFDFKFWTKILSVAWPLAITIVLNLVYLRSDILFLSVIERPSDMGVLAEVGIYGAAYKVIDVLITFPFMFAGIILPILTAKWAENNKKDFNKVLQKSFDVLAIFALPMVVGTQFVAGDVMKLVAGEEFAASGPVLRILIIASGAIFLGNMFAHAVIALDKQKKIIGAYLFTAVTAVLGYMLLIPEFSFIGAAWVTVYSEAVIALASLYYVRKYSGFLPCGDVFLKSLAASAVMAMFLAYAGSKTDSIAALIISSGIVYFFLLYLFKGLSARDINDLLNRPDAGKQA